jgi:hypothetical protein
MRKRIKRPSPALIVAIVALVLALGGTASAIVITSASIADGTIQARDIGLNQINKGNVGDNAFGSREAYDGALGGVDVKDNDLKGKDINESTVGATGVVNAGGGLITGRSATVRHPQLGVYCISATDVPGTVTPRERPITLTMDKSGDSTNATTNLQAFAEWASTQTVCNGNEWEVRTFQRALNGQITALNEGFAFTIL